MVSGRYCLLTVALFLTALAASTITYHADAGPAGPRADNADIEPNDDRISASNITMNVSLTGSLYGNDEKDFYRLDLDNATPQDVVNVSLDLTNLGTTLVLTVWDPNDIMLIKRTVTNEVVNVSFGAIYAGSHFLLLSKAEGQIDYDLDVEVGELAFLPDGNDAMDEAGPMGGVGAVFVTTDDLTGVTDLADYYSFHIKTGTGFVDVAYIVLDVPSGADMALGVYKPDGTRLVLFDGGGTGEDERHHYLASAPSMDLFLRVWLIEGGGQYNLTVDLVRGYVTDNNNFTNAVAIISGDSVVGNVSSGVDEADFYKLAARGGSEMEAAITIDGYNGSTMRPALVLEVFSWDGERADLLNASSPVPGTATVTAYAEFDMDLVLVVRAGGFGAHGAYGLDIALEAPPWVVDGVDPNVTIDEDGSGAIDLEDYFDDDPGRVLTYGFTGNDTIMVDLDSPIMTFSSHIENWYGTEQITLSATNDLLRTETLDLNVTFLPVNDAPFVHYPWVNITIDEDTNYSSSVLFLDTRFSDVDQGDALTFSAVGNGSIVVGFDGSMMSIHPPADWFGSITFTIVATDMGGLSNESSVGLHVLPVPDPPVVGAHVTTIDMEEDGSGILNLSGVFRDPDGEALNYTISSESSVINLDVRQIGNDSVWIIDPVSNWSGQENVRVYATDPTGATASISVTVNVAPVNDGPVVIYSANQDLQVKAKWEMSEDKDAVIDMKALFTDGDGDDLSYSYSIDDPAAQVTAVLTDGVLRVRPAPNWYGDVALTLNAADPEFEMTETSVVLQFHPVNDRPILGEGSVTPLSGDEDATFVFSVTYSDIEGDVPTVYLVALIEGQDERHFIMTYEHGDYKTNAQYTISTKLPGGTTAYYFTANDHGRTDSLVQTETRPIQVDEVPEPFVIDYWLVITILLVITLAVVIVWVLGVSVSRSRHDYSWDDDEELEDLEEEELDDDFWQDKSTKKKKTVKKARRKVVEDDDDEEEEEDDDDEEEEEDDDDEEEEEDDDEDD